ncbi:MAG: hypothetical protein NVV82_20475 [Sporocytophaga sp.]|nr:hypothetical protein [Sporocytophaga sp.]
MKANDDIYLVEILIKERSTLLEELETLDNKREEIKSKIEGVNRMIQRNSIPQKDELMSHTSVKPIKIYNQEEVSTKAPKLIKSIDYTGTNLFLIGLEVLGGEATASQVAAEISKYDVDVIHERIKDGSLKQWLTVSANSLVKAERIEKIGRTDRKGGVLYSYPAKKK